MKKVVYVEGVTELVFVYNLVCTHYEYDGSRVQIHNIDLDPIAGLQIPADFGLTDAPDYFQIVCVGGDSKVISKMKERYQGHISTGFDIIVGLKDVYGDAYVSLAGHQMDEKIVAQLMAIQREQLAQEQKAILCYAIMEVESWILGMTDFLSREYSLMAVERDVNPETKFVHPYNVLHDGFGAIGVQFEKHWGDILSVLNKVTKDDFEQLYASVNCHSFNEFYDVLFR